jgi:hypothetical protein
MLAGLNMTEFSIDDVTIEHIRLCGGCGYLRLIHRLSGMSVSAETHSERPVEVKKRLLTELEAKVKAASSDGRK